MTLNLNLVKRFFARPAQCKRDARAPIIAINWQTIFTIDYKKITFIFFALCLFSSGAFAQTNSASAIKTVPANFKSDGCSLFPDCDYRDCCVEHDKAYYFGGSWTKRWQADKKLFKCVAAKKGFEHKIIAPLMWLGVRVGGVSWLPTRFRWGFGRKKLPK